METKTKQIMADHTDALRVLLRAFVWCMSEASPCVWWVDFDTLRAFLRERDVGTLGPRADVCVWVDGSTQRRALRGALQRCLARHEGFDLETLDADRCRLCYRGARLHLHQYQPESDKRWLECRSRPQSRICASMIGEPVLVWWGAGAAFVPIPEHAVDVVAWRCGEGLFSHQSHQRVGKEEPPTVYGELLQGWTPDTNPPSV